MRPGRAALVLSVLPAAIPLASSIAQAGPSRPGDGRAQAPVVGRVQTRDAVFDLTREAFFEGGPAFAASVPLLLSGAVGNLSDRVRQLGAHRVADLGCEVSRPREVLPGGEREVVR